MTIVDDDMADILFLAQHQGWTWQALQDAPEHIVEGLRLLDSKRA